jgi:hypothetical protein
VGFDFFNGAYVFATPVLGGQATVALGSLFGRATADVNGTLTASLGPFIAGRPINIDSGVTGFGDLLPQVYLKWNEGVNNFMLPTDIELWRARFQSCRAGRRWRYDRQFPFRS